MILIGIAAFAILFVSVIAYTRSPAGKAAIAEAKARKQKFTTSAVSKSNTLEYIGAIQTGRTSQSHRRHR